MGFQERFDLSSFADRLACVATAVRVARWIDRIHASDLIHRVEFLIGVKQIVPGRRELTLLSTGDGVKKKYLKLTEVKSQRLMRFYHELQRAGAGGESASVERGEGIVPYMEFAVRNSIVLDRADHETERSLAITLRPMGISRRPTTKEELISALRMILTSLQVLHQRGWAHLDLRWPNVIFLPDPDRWFIIDCEFVTSLNENCESKLVLFDPAGSAERVDAACDLYLVGKMMLEVSHLFDQSGAANELALTLIGDPTGLPLVRRERTATWALNHRYLSRDQTQS